MMFFFFFKQKTAYEMRISDWSSDVCSSDLNPKPPLRDVQHRRELQLLHGSRYLRGRWSATVLVESIKRSVFVLQPGQNRSFGPTGPITCSACPPIQRCAPIPPLLRRSEEHTSELQSLMRISFAVFCF